MEQLSRKERRRAERQTRKERIEKQREKRRTFEWVQKLLISLTGAALVVGLGYWAYGKWTTGWPGEFVPSLGNRHIDPSEVGLIKYNSDPPTSGPHLPAIARWGVHDSPVPKELQVHNLEDGGVVVQYNCPQTNTECKALIAKLAEIVGKYEHTILAPYLGLSHKVALTAWTRIDKLDEFDEKRIVRFIEAYHDIDHHPQK
jgi:hypothetical protein